MIDVLEKYSKRLQYLYFDWVGYAFAWERGGGEKWKGGAGFQWQEKENVCMRVRKRGKVENVR